ncbi:MAG TPA: hypothetical protein PLS51_14025 [Flavobacterium sp.]|nr:hypothetical protein [Flavobacterium sp.]HPJ11746.1 hypothetical protein [Flavobacterium sp.]
MRKILPLFSYVFHPVFIPVLGTLAYFFWGKNYFEPAQQVLILLQIVIITILIPMAFLYLLKTLGKVDSFMVSDLSQRKVPLVIQVILMVILLRQSITIDRIPELFFFFAGGIASALLTLILLFAKIKASLHMMGISALTVFTMALSIYNQVNLINVIAILLLANGLVAASRLEMKAHTGTELVIGFLFGVLPQLLLLYCWL